MLQIAHLTKEQLNGKFLEDLHKSIFDSELPSDFFRYDGCLVAQNAENDIVTYALIREISSETVELAWGGTSKEHRGIATKIAMDHFTQECLRYYSSVMYQTWNKNIPMIKLGLSLDYIIVGSRIADNGDLFLILNRKR